jgi:hypothetical protein
MSRSHGIRCRSENRNRSPPLLPFPSRRLIQRSLRMPPAPDTMSPASGFVARKRYNSAKPSSSRYSSRNRVKASASTNWNLRICAESSIIPSSHYTHAGYSCKTDRTFGSHCLQAQTNIVADADLVVPDRRFDVLNRCMLNALL